ncbi:MAG: response regulator [Halomonadaceae bacterium]|nr:MAG: response regulator [Halomonadaceae bacterium]
MERIQPSNVGCQDHNTTMKSPLSIQDPVPLIYVVEDNCAIRDSLELLLHTCGWQVHLFAHGSDFLDQLPIEPQQPCCLLLDIHLPDINGAELQEQLQARLWPASTILLTAQPHNPLVQRALNAGAVTVMGKPFEARDLLQLIRATLSNQPH